MPELPEVETIKNDLAPHLVGRRFTSVEVLWPRLVKHPSAEELQRHLPNQQVASLSRRGKYLIADLASGQALIFHLKMTGALLLDAPSDRYTRAIFTFDSSCRLLFSDKRKLAALWLVPQAEMVVARLGPEPLSPAFNPEVLAEQLARRSAPIKAILLDQAVIAGIGNLYADEALFEAGLHPLRPASSLTSEEITLLYSQITSVLRRAIENRGSTFSDYRTPDGAAGRHQESFQVAHRKGQPCPSCGTPIQRLAIRNRGSCFCPRCQS